MSKNTAFTLMYRDASNYKFFEYVVLEGQMTQDQYNAIREKVAALEEPGFIIAEQLGLPTPAEKAAAEYDFPTEDDHVFTTVCAFEDDVEDVTELYTDEEHTTDMTIDALVNTIMGVQEWNIAAEAERLGMA